MSSEESFYFGTDVAYRLTPLKGCAHLAMEAETVASCRIIKEEENYGSCHP